MICKHCGKQIPDDSIFCFYCSQAVAPTSTTTKVRGGKARTSSGGSSAPNLRKPIVIGIAIVLILALLGAVAALFLPGIPVMRGQSDTISAETATLMPVSAARRGIPAISIVAVLLVLVVLAIIFLLFRRAFAGGAGKAIVIGVLVLLILAAIGFVVIRVFNIETPDSLGSEKRPSPASRLDDDDYDDDYDPSEEPARDYGYNVGNLCYGADLPILDSYGETGATIDPTETGKVTVIYFWGTWCTPCINELPYYEQIADRYGDDVAVVAIHTAISGDTAPDYIAENYPNSRIIFALDAEEDSSYDYYTWLGGTSSYPYTVILDENGVILYVSPSTVSFEELSAIVETNILY